MVKRGWIVATSCALGLSAASCGSSPPPSAASATDGAEPAASDEPSNAVTAETRSAPEGGDETVALDPETDEAELPPPLEVRYHVSSEGLRVTVSEVEFIPRATPVRVGAGWGVKIDVSARARDDQPHVLFRPEQGPLAFFAVVNRSGKKEERGDHRRGQGEEYVTENGIEFSRTWPGNMGMQPLAAGEQLELQVGLWGVGKSMTRHRPLKGFFTVKMVGGSQAQAVVSPPSTTQ